MERKLSAILAADVVGYSRLMEEDEAGTFGRLQGHRKELFEPKIAKHKGRIFKLMGDGLLAEFGSAVDAVECAVDLQRGMAERNEGVAQDHRVEVRIGVNLGDVIVEGEDRHGEGVNIAARLQQIAEPGGVLVSGTTYDHTKNKIKAGFEDLGRRTMKNIAEPIHIYRITAAPTAQVAIPKPVTYKPSIAVLPFINMSSDAEQAYFADGLAEDLITDLSKVSGLFVIARNSSFAYKGKSIDMRLVAKDLGVRYVIEGSVRRSAARVRINVQLIDAIENRHLWADRYDRDLANIFDLQDEVVRRIIDALADKLPGTHPVARRRAANLQAYDLFTRGRVLAMQSPEGNRAARSFLERAIELDPYFAEAHSWLAMANYSAWAHSGESEEIQRPLARLAAERAVSLDPNDASARAILAYVRLFEGGNLNEASVELAEALRVNPNNADAWLFFGEVKVMEGRAAEGIEDVRNAFRLNPYPPGVYYWILGMAQYAAGQYAAATETLLHEATHGSGSRRILAASLAQAGHLEEARVEAGKFLAMNPQFSVRHWASIHPFQQEQDRQHFIDGYIKAGLPE